MSKLFEVRNTDITLIDGDRGENYPSREDFYPEEYCLFLDTGNVTQDGFNFSSTQFITKEKDEQLRNGKLKRNDIVMTTRGSVGNVALYDDTVPYENVRINSGMIIIRCGNDYSPQLLYYYLRSQLVKKQISDLISGSVQKQLPASTINFIKLPDPKYNIDTQLLRKIELKITHNSHICSELEAMAKTLYDYWFVQFDFPDENGKPYRTSGGEMVWNEQLKQEIPKGWKAGTIGDLGTIVSGGTPNTSCEEYYCTDGYAWITPNDLSGNTDKMFVSHGERDVTIAGIENSSAVLMPKHSVLLSTRAPIGYLAISENEVCTNQGFKSIVPDTGYSELFIYYVLKSNIPAIAQQGVGTTFKEVSKETLSRFKIPIPQIKLTERFATHISSGCTKRKILENECKELTKLRDWLLPMLMNGQARVE